MPYQKMNLGNFTLKDVLKKFWIKPGLFRNQDKLVNHLFQNH